VREFVAARPATSMLLELEVCRATGEPYTYTRKTLGTCATKTARYKYGLLPSLKHLP